MSDWVGNSRATWVTLAASNHSEFERETNDYYATEPKALDVLIEGGYKPSSNKILEPSAGEGHLSKRLIELGYDVTSYDLIDRGYCPVKDFFDIDRWEGCILTNPPYKYAQQFVEHALDIIPDGQEVAMFLKVQFLEGQARRKLFDTKQLKAVYVASKRLNCARNGEFDKYTSSAVAYAWFVWQKGFKGDPIIKWIN